MRTKLFEDALIIVESLEGKLYVTNKLSGNEVLLIGSFDGWFELHVQ